MIDILSIILIYKLYMNRFYKYRKEIINIKINFDIVILLFEIQKFI